MKLNILCFISPGKGDIDEVYRSIFAVMVVLGTHNVWAADQIAPADPSFHFSVDNNLRAQVPADILKRGYLIVGTNPNTPPTTFYKKITRR